MKELLCIDAKDSDFLVENEIYHPEDVIACDVCDTTFYVLHESKPADNSVGWSCGKCKSVVNNPSNKTPYAPERFVELDAADVEELMDIVSNKTPVAKSKIRIYLSDELSARIFAH